MAGPLRYCPGCGTELQPGIKFCGQCGMRLDAPAAGEGEAAPQPQEPPPAGQQGQAGAPQPAAPGSGKQTMLGMTAAGGSPAAPPAGPQQPPAEPSAEAPAQQPPAQQPPAQQPPAQQPSGSAGAGPDMKRTLLGMPAAGSPGGPQPPAQQPQQPPAQQPPAQQPPAQQPPAQQPPEQQASGPAGPAGRTMLGMPAQQLPDPAQQPPQQAQPSSPAGQAPDPGTGNPAAGRTMLGMAAQTPPSPSPASPGAPSQSAAAPPAAPARERRRVSYPPSAGPVDPSQGAGESQDISMSLPTRGPKIRLLPVFLVVFALVVIGGAAVGGWLLLSGDEIDVEVSVVQTNKGDALQVRLPEAPDGTKVRFSDTERALEAGEAQFPLDSDDLHVGDNELSIAVVDPDEEVEQVDVTLTLEYRVRADLSHLDEDPPAIVIVVDAPAGSTVALDGEPAELDGSGHAEKRYPLEAKEPSGPNPVLEHEVSYRVAPPDGEPASGKVRTRIPYATLQIDRPGDDVITDEESIEIAGAVHERANVTIDGGEVKVTAGRFLYEYPLPDVGEYDPTIVAKRPERAPRQRTIHIQRVEDLEQEAASFAADPELDYARISQNPNIYKGRKVELVGRVYNARIEGGEGMLQMLVRDCPRDKCPLWVTYSAAAEPSVDSWVRVLGEVAGEQQFRAESDEIMTVPRIEASFVLPAER